MDDRLLAESFYVVLELAPSHVQEALMRPPTPLLSLPPLHPQDLKLELSKIYGIRPNDINIMEPMHRQTWFPDERLYATDKKFEVRILNAPLIWTSSWVICIIGWVQAAIHISYAAYSSTLSAPCLLGVEVPHHGCHEQVDAQQ